MGSDDIRAAQDMIETRVLRNWPFPALVLVLDPDWNVLRNNAAFAQIFGAFMPRGNSLANLLEVMMSDAFQWRIQNWDRGIAYGI